MKTRFIIIMGVSGTGKTTIGKALSARLGWDFTDADDLHPPANIKKMAAGIPLTDDDRRPWLAALHDLIFTCLAGARPGILACSALKESYRQTLLAGNPDVKIVYLKGSYELLLARMQQRPAHFMKPAMLKSQFETLEEPLDALTLDISLPVEEMLDRIVAALQ
jgi:gluconokinase